MSINWLYSQHIEGIIEFPQLFSSSGILISISNISPPSWRKMGVLRIEQLIESEFFEAQILSVKYGNSKIQIPYYPYRLTFEPVENLLVLYPNISIKIAEYDTNMFINNPPATRAALGEPIYSTITPAQANAPTPVFQIVPPRDRASVLIVNKTNRSMYIKEGASTTESPLVAAPPFTEITANGSYTVLDFTGEIVGRMATNYTATTRVYVKEMPYL
jgi:hypothetical protein